MTDGMHDLDKLPESKKGMNCPNCGEEMKQHIAIYTDPDTNEEKDVPLNRWKCKCKGVFYLPEE